MSAFRDPEIYRSILESLPTGVCVVDMQKKILLWSDGAERITGHLRHEVIGQSSPADGVLHCDPNDNEGGPLARAMKTSQPAEALGFVHHKAGHEIRIHARAVPIHNSHGSIVGAVETFEEQQPADSDHREDSLNVPGCVDEVTRVASRAVMQSHLRETVGTFAEVRVPFGVLMFKVEGLDHFRARLGPDAAVALLRAIARTLENALWRTDIVGRWSEDQFLVILNGCSAGALHSVRERIRRMLASDGIDWWGERRSLPISIAQVAAQSGDSMESILDRIEKSFETSAQLPGLAATGGGSSAGSQ